MKKQDMEYQSCQEFTPLPDEYPQSMEHGRTSIQTSDSLSKRGHKSILKRMMQMMTVFSVVTYTAVTVADAQPIARPDLPKTIIAVKNGVEDHETEIYLSRTESQSEINNQANVKPIIDDIAMIGFILWKYSN